MEYHRGEDMERVGEMVAPHKRRSILPRTSRCIREAPEALSPPLQLPAVSENGEEWQAFVASQKASESSRD